MRYASVCDGISAASVAWQPLGWQCVWISEINPFCNALLAQRWPGHVNLGDMMALTEDMLHARGPIDLLVGGTPCQSFSTAGLRRGLADPRGNLALRFCQLAGLLRPHWLVWENVPGVLSSGNGRDFGAILGAMAELGYGFAYRVLDAQYFGVPQRRRRVFVVGHLGDWRPAAAVLFERHSLSGNPPPSRKAGAETAGPLTRCTPSSRMRCDSSDNEHFIPEVVSPLTNGQHMGGGSMGRTPTAAGSSWMPEVAMCLQEREAKGQDSDCTRTLVATGGFFDTAHQLTARYDSSEDGCGRGTPIMPAAFTFKESMSVPSWGENVCETLQAANCHAVAFVDANPALRTSKAKPNAVHRLGTRVRRLTPRECERLQGFPDDYTAITYRGKPAADGPRYQALGNSMAVPVMAWIGRRIMAATSAKEDSK